MIMRFIRLLQLNLLIVIFFIGFNSSAFAGLSSPSSQESEEIVSSGKMMIDLVIARPLGLIGATVSSTLFVLGLPYSILSRSVKSSFNTLVTVPFKETLVRCLGCQPAKD